MEHRENGIRYKNYSKWDNLKNNGYDYKNNGLIGLKILRKQHHLNQQKIAMDLNISREVISYYENGKRNPDIQMLKILSAYFNVSIDFLINGKEFEKS